MFSPFVKAEGTAHRIDSLLPYCQNLFMSTKYEAVVQPEGRILIPAALRKAVRIEPGDRVLIRRQGDDLVVTPVGAVKAHLRELFSDAGGSMSAELISERRAEAKRERGG